MLKYLNTDHCSDTGIEDFSAERLKTAEHHLNLRKAGKAGEESAQARLWDGDALVVCLDKKGMAPNWEP